MRGMMWDYKMFPKATIVVKLDLYEFNGAGGLRDWETSSNWLRYPALPRATLEAGSSLFPENEAMSRDKRPALSLLLCHGICR